MQSTVQGLEQLVFRLSSLLLYPTLALLVWGVLRIFWVLGEEARESASSRPARVREAGRRLRGVRPTSAAEVAAALEAVTGDGLQSARVRRFADELRREVGVEPAATLTARARHLAARHESELARDVDRIRLLVRVGPCLGLAGTLIPLGPGLAALGDGDLERLSAQLIVAFSTTVVGLVIGGAAYALSVGRAHRADRTAADVEFLYDLVVATASAESLKPRSEPEG